VGDRGSKLAVEAEQQISMTVEFLSGLSEDDLHIICPDDRGGSTIGSVAVHTGKGYNQAVRFLMALGIMLNDPTATPTSQSEAYRMMHGGGGGHGHDHDHHHDDHVHDISPTIAQLKADGRTASDVLSKLSDEQLDLVPPAIGTMSDGRKSLADVVAGTVEHQLAHLNRMRQAYDAARSPA
jgi:hypothetical protein